MKIDFFISSLSGGGAENVLLTLAKALSYKGNTVSVTSLEKRPQFYTVDEKIELIKINNTSSGKIRNFLNDFKQVKKLLTSRNTDITISFLSRCNILVLLCTLFHKKKVIVCDRNNPLKEHSKIVFYLSCLLYLKATRIIVQTKEIQSFYPWFLQKKLEVIENPIDTDKLLKQIESEVFPDNTVISLGRLEPQKDFKSLITAFAMISEEFIDWRLLIFGQGNMREELQKLIDELQVSDKVKLCGRTERPFFELKKSKVFVLSSNYEGFPNVLCEAMYAGLACISTNCVSGPKELIKNGENGELVEIGNIEGIKTSLRKVLQDSYIRVQYGKNAKKTVERLYLDKIIEKWEKTLEHCNCSEPSKFDEDMR